MLLVAKDGPAFFLSQSAKPCGDCRPDPVVFIGNSSDITLENLYITRDVRGDEGDLFSASTVRVEVSPNTVLRHVYISSTDGTSLSFTGSNDAVVEDCVIENARFGGVVTTVKKDGSGGVTIRNSALHAKQSPVDDSRVAIIGTSDVCRRDKLTETVVVPKALRPATGRPWKLKCSYLADLSGCEARRDEAVEGVNPRLLEEPFGVAPPPRPDRRRATEGSVPKKTLESRRRERPPIIALCHSSGLRPAALREVQDVIEERRDEIVLAWQSHFEGHR